MNDERGTRDDQRAGTNGVSRMGGPPSQDGQIFAGDAMPGPAGGAGPGPVTGSEAGGPDAPGGPDGSGASDPTRRSRRGKSKGRARWIELPILLAFALVLALLIKTFVVQAFFIPSSSMENTLEIGDKVLVNKMVYDFRPIRRGDVVVFNGEGSWDPVPTQPKPPLVRLWNAISGLFGTAPGVHDYIKRVIGIPGDHVACCDSQGRITVNGVPLTEKSYLYPGNSPSTEDFSIIVPRGRLWVMGDHRSVSYDSRGHMQDPGNGTVPQDRVVGRAFVIVAPVSRWRVLPIPATFDQPRLSSAFAGAQGHGGTPALPTLTGPVAAAVPLGLGLVGAFPLTWLQMRLRRRLGGSPRRARPLARPGRVPRGPQRPGPG
jgi:signal peptidase I